MRPFVAFRRLTLLTLFALSALPATRAVAADHGPAEPGPLAFTVLIPQGRVSLKLVHDAVLRAAVKRGWLIKENQDMRVVIHLLRHRYEATVTFLISDKSVKAFCVGYKVDRHGQRLKPEQPKSWLGFLQRDISKDINTAAYGGK